jgi:hypothetical protein
MLLVLFVAGCGGSSRAVVTFKAPATVRLAGAESGAHIACQKGPGPAPGHTLPNGRLVTGTVPPPGKSVGWVNGLGIGGIDLALIRGADGSLVVKCS